MRTVGTSIEQAGATPLERHAHDSKGIGTPWTSFMSHQVPPYPSLQKRPHRQADETADAAKQTAKGVPPSDEIRQPGGLGSGSEQQKGPLCAAAGRCGLGCGTRCIPLEFFRKTPAKERPRQARLSFIGSGKPQPRAQRRCRRSTMAMTNSNIENTLKRLIYTPSWS